MREHLEKQLNEEQKVRCELFNYFLFLFQTLQFNFNYVSVVYQKRFKKERRFRKKLEQEIHQIQKQNQILQNNKQQQQQQQQQVQSNQASLKSPPSPQQQQQQSNQQPQTVETLD